MGQKKYISQRTRTTHTYSFYRQRRNDPNWRADYLEARTQRQRHILFTLIIKVTGQKPGDNPANEASTPVSLDDAGTSKSGHVTTNEPGHQGGPIGN